RGGRHPAGVLARPLPAAAPAGRTRAAEPKRRRLLAGGLVDVFFAGVFVGLGNFYLVLGGFHGMHAVQFLGGLFAVLLGLLGIGGPVEQRILGVGPELVTACLLDRE